MESYFNSSLLEKAVAELSKLPGIGRKTALRLALHLLRRDENDALALGEALIEMRRNITYCKCCHNISEETTCPICSDKRRDRSVVCVVENVKDVITIESTHQHHGLYHVLHGALSPMDGITPDDIKINELLLRLGSDKVKEVIMATNPTVEGETTAMYISRLLKPLGVKVTRLAYGIPVGGDLEYADEVTLVHALEGRNEL